MMRTPSSSASAYEPLAGSDAAALGGGEEEEEELCCRICLEEDVRENFIAPCGCRGTQRFVHRRCLDTWRSTREDRAWARCTECLVPYRLKLADDAAPTKWSQLEFKLFVARDFFFVFMVSQLAVSICAFLLRTADRRSLRGAVLGMFAKGCVEDHRFNGGGEFFCHHTLSAYYIAGVVLALAFVGLAGSAYFCANGCQLEATDETTSHREPTPLSSSAPARPRTTSRGPTPIRHHRGRSDNCGDCCILVVQGDEGDCNGCLQCCGQCGECECKCPESGGNGGGNGGEGLLVIFLIALAILAVIGLIIVLVLGAAIVQRTFQRHMHRQIKYRLAHRYEVVDLSTSPDAGMPMTDVPPPAADPHVASAPPLVPSMPDSSPTAPPLPLAEARRLAKLGLL